MVFIILVGAMGLEPILDGF